MTQRADMFVDPDEDPRHEPPGAGGELETLLGFLRWQRETLELKCSGLDAEQLARRSVEPSTLSLLGLVRHMADVERWWFRRFMAGEDVPPLYYSAEDRDGEFNGAVADARLVTDAWDAWRAEVEYADRFVTEHDLDTIGKRNDHDRGSRSLRWVLVHMIEEYARHLGHVDLLRERIDGALGQ
jgi:uncharacterized damage-inducible protein DinB